MHPDERFATPRAVANSSRSNGTFATPRSFQSSSSDGEGTAFATPRSTFTTPRSTFATPRSTFATPRSSLSFVERDRSKDFRRFPDRPATAIPRNPHRETNYYNANHFERRGGSSMTPCDLINSDGITIDRQKSFRNVNLYDNDSRRMGSVDIFSLARHGRVDEIEDMLMNGTPVNQTDEHGNSILAIGSQNGSKRVVKLALRYGADINAVNNSGNTALHFCFRYGFSDTLGRYLMSKGADTSIRNAEGKTCFES